MIAPIRAVSSLVGLPSSVDQTGELSVIGSQLITMPNLKFSDLNVPIASFKAPVWALGTAA